MLNILLSKCSLFGYVFVIARHTLCVCVCVWVLCDILKANVFIGAFCYVALLEAAMFLAVFLMATLRVLFLLLLLFLFSGGSERTIVNIVTTHKWAHSCNLQNVLKRTHR